MVFCKNHVYSNHVFTSPGYAAVAIAKWGVRKRKRPACSCAAPGGIYLSIYLSIYLYLSLSIYIYICIYTYISLYLSLYIYIYIHIHIHIYIYVYIYIYIYTHTYVYIHICGSYRPRIRSGQVLLLCSTQFASQELRPNGPNPRKVLRHSTPIDKRAPRPPNPWAKHCAASSRDPLVSPLVRASNVCRLVGIIIIIIISLMFVSTSKHKQSLRKGVTSTKKSTYIRSTYRREC